MDDYQDSTLQESIAFLDVMTFEEGKAFRGGIFVTDINTYPLEFRVTSPIRPTLLQKMLYGSTLESYIYTELVAVPLLRSIKSDPLFVSEGPGTGNTKAMKTKISSSGSNYYVVFSSGPSADPEFIFYKDGEFNQAAFSISALDIVIPGNGFIYSSGHTNNMFNKRRKFKVENKEENRRK